MRRLGGTQWGMLLGAALIIGGVPASALADKTVDETKAAAATGTVEIEIVAGKIVITGSDRNEVTVKGTTSDDATLEFTGGPTRTTIKLRGQEKHGFFGMRGQDIDCDLQIQVPAGSEVAAQTVSADLAISGVKGEVELETVSGMIKASGEPERASLKSVSGAIDVTAVTPRVHAESVSGAIKLEGPNGEAEVSTVSGDVLLTGSRLREVECTSVSGAITVDAGLTSDARWEISNHSGDVVVKLPADVSADFSIETFSGDISSEFGGEAQRKSKYVPGEELEFTAGSGDAHIEISSFSGTVRVTKK